MPRRLMTALFPLFCAASLAGCGSVPTVLPEVRVEVVTVPALLLTRVDAPVIPSPAAATQKDVAELLADYAAALETANGKLEAIERLQKDVQP